MRIEEREEGRKRKCDRKRKGGRLRKEGEDGRGKRKRGKM